MSRTSAATLINSRNVDDVEGVEDVRGDVDDVEDAAFHSDKVERCEGGEKKMQPALSRRQAPVLVAHSPKIRPKFRRASDEFLVLTD